MTFEEMLDQAMAMLQRRRRIAYPTLQVQFNLDDNALEVLKDALLYAQQVTQDEDGRVLVWTGGTDTAPSPSPPLYGRMAHLSLDSRDPVVYNRRMVLGGGQAAGGDPLWRAASVIGVGMEDIP